MLEWVRENHWCITKDTKVKPAWWWEGDRIYMGNDDFAIELEPQPVVSLKPSTQQLVPIRAELGKLRTDLYQHIDSPYHTNKKVGRIKDGGF